jgi:uncharacterized protein (TIGR01777 family)
MNILITGGTGFIGSFLSMELLREGHMIRIITRNPAKYRDSEARNQQFVSWDNNFREDMQWADAVINLAGENIFGQRWTPKVKEKIYNSRIEGTRQLVDGMNEADDPPKTFISASAVGFYGDTGGDLTDEHAGQGNDFLAEVCSDWEAEARKVPESVRLVIPRLGIALEKGGGALQQMLLPFKLFMGGPVGGGEQYVPWIHMRDLRDGLQFMLHEEKIEGVYNLVAPNPVTMQVLADEIAAQLNRPSWLPVPEMMLKLILGEAATPILASLNISSQKIQDAGYEFSYEQVDIALADILNN